MWVAHCVLPLCSPVAVAALGATGFVRTLSEWELPRQVRMWWSDYYIVLWRSKHIVYGLTIEEPTFPSVLYSTSLRWKHGISEKVIMQAGAGRDYHRKQQWMHLILFSLFINCFPVMCCISDACRSSCLCRSCSKTDLQPSHGASSVRVGALPVPCLALIFFPRLFVMALSSLLSNTTDMVKVPETTSHCIEFKCYKKKCASSLCRRMESALML